MLISPKRLQIAQKCLYTKDAHRSEESNELALNKKVIKQKL